MSTSPTVLSSSTPSPYPVSQMAAPLTPQETRRSAARASILFAVALLLLIFLGYKLLKELEIIYVSALFAVVLMPVISMVTNLNLRGYRPSRGVAVLLLLFTIVIFLTLFVTLGLPPVLRDLRAFLTDLPARIPALTARIKGLPIADAIGVDQLAARAENFAGAIGAYLFSSLPLWLSHIADILTAVFLTIYFILEGEHAYHFFLSLFSSEARRRLDTTMKRAEQKMSKWLIGQGLLMLILGVLSTIVFGFLHVRYFLLLGVMMGLFNLIPIAGAVITVSLAALVAGFDSPGKMAGVLIFYAIYLNVENAYLTPRIMRSSVNLSGLTVLIALLLGTALAGVVGALVAVPTAALVSVLLEEYAVQH